MNVLLMMERRLSSQIITILLDKIEKLNREKAIVEAELKLTKESINDFKAKYQAMKREGNALKRYNSRLVFNSFISDLTEVPKKDGNSQVRIKQIYRDYSNNSMKNMWYDLSKDQEKEPASS
jgi:predicted PolB exonuclease-like 3'-5' exonuclease